MSTLNSLFGGLSLSFVFHSLDKGFWNLILTFVTHHWTLAVVNSGMTALLGLGLLRLLPRPPNVTMPRQPGLRGFLFRDRDLHLRRLLFVAVLCKGTFYLVLGDGHQPSHYHTQPVAYGFQMPNPWEVMRLIPQTPDTIWRPTAVTEQVILLLGGMAFILLLRRARQIMAVLSFLKALTGVSEMQSDQHKNESEIGLSIRLQAALGRAGIALGYSSSSRLPEILLAELPVATPILVGLTQPYILLAPSLVQEFSDAELEAALRHELAHFRRRDHWWRWLLLWVGDVGRLNPLSSWINERALDSEEDLCDRWAATSRHGAAALARALMKSQAHFAGRSGLPTDPGIITTVSTSWVIPNLLGITQRSREAALEHRLKGLLEVARTSQFPLPVSSDPMNHRRAAGVSPQPSRKRFGYTLTALREGWALLIVSLLIAVIYTKFFLLIIVN